MSTEAPLTKRSILLVEDDADIGRMYVLGFETAGYDIRLVSDGGTALAEFARRLPDVAILDWDLPRIRGDVLLKMLRRNKRTRHVPVMFLSNYRQSDTKIAGAIMDGEPVPWVVKAETTPAELSVRVGKLLGSVDRRPTSPTAA